jgi:TRAP-type C4-dicarboxylate transport system substrate-binding protein
MVKWAWVAVLLILISARSVSASGEVIVKMATLAPQGTEWHKVLLEMGAAWQKASRGQVLLRLYPGGVAGDDTDVVRKMRLGTLDAGLLTVIGLSIIERNVLVLEVPLAYANYGELDCVLHQVGPQLEKQFEAKGFVVLGWSDGGWAHFFTKSPARTPDDMKKMKMFVSEGDDQYVELMKKSGFNPVPLPSTEIATALQTGLVNAVTSTAQGVVLLQWYNQVHYMNDFNWAVLLGGIVVSKAAWEKIPRDLRPALKEEAVNTCRRLQEFSRQSEPKDIEVLKKHGLQIVPVDSAVLNDWRQLIQGVLPQVRGAYVAAEPLDNALRLRDGCRRQAAPISKQ